jgi:cytochrome c2
MSDFSRGGCAGPNRFGPTGGPRYGDSNNKDYSQSRKSEAMTTMKWTPEQYAEYLARKGNAVSVPNPKPSKYHNVLT